MNGYSIIIMLGGSQMAAVKSHEVTTSAETIEVSSPTDGEWRHFIAGRKEWSASASYLVLSTAGSNITDLLKVGNTYEIISRDRQGNYGVKGTAICTQCKHTYTIGNLCAGSFSFRGTGVLASGTT